jgi:hypothetical protein
VKEYLRPWVVWSEFDRSGVGAYMHADDMYEAAPEDLRAPSRTGNGVGISSPLSVLRLRAPSRTGGRGPAPRAAAFGTVRGGSSGSSTSTTG